MKRIRILLLILSLTMTGLAAAAQNPVPQIDQPLVPGAAAPGGKAFTLTVNGSGFVSGSVVSWNGHPLTTKFVGKSRLTASVPASEISKAGTSAVTVLNPGQGSGSSNVIFFEVTPSSSSIGLGETSFGSPASPSSVAVGDFNRDGKLDLAVANLASDNISILLGSGDGTFQNAVTYGVGSGPRMVNVGDFNGDGKLDLVVTNAGANNVSVLLGNGNGTFEAADNYGVGENPNSVAVGDFNGDGKLDLAAANGYSNNVSILLGNGDGTFQTAVTYEAGEQPMAIATGDFNSDGKLDLAVTNYSGANVSALLGNGDGTFKAAVNYSAGQGPNSIEVADFNGDGKLDLAVANTVDFDVSVLLGNGDGTFKATVNYSAGQGPKAVAVGDFNGDGKLDLVTANNPDDSVSLLFGNGDGTFRKHLDFTGLNQPESLAVGDFNGDGRLDMAAALLLDNVGILLQVPTVTLSPASLSFGDRVVATSSGPKTVTLTNTSGLVPTVVSVAITGTDATDFRQTNDCGSRLAIGAHCTISVTFEPSHIGPRTASLTTNDTATGTPQESALGGTGVVSGPNATLSNASLTFATQLVGTTSPAQSVTLNNYGTATLTITNIAFKGTDPSDFQQTDTCGSSVAPGASCTISVYFKPTGINTRTVSLSITDNAPSSPQTVALNGTGTVVKLNPNSLGFGVHQVGTTATLSTSLTNVGSTALSIAGVAVRGTDADEFSETNTCGSSVGAGKSCTIRVTFKPSERGSDSAAVSISDNGGGSPQTVSLSGSGCVIVNHRCKAALSRMMKSALAASQTAAAPVPTGSSKVGTRIINLVDSTRDDPFSANGTKRELLVRFWYPASVEDTCKPAEYTSPKVWSYFAELTRLPLPSVSTHACLDAPVANSAHPVVVFTHGYTGTFTDYTFLFEDLASRGYVVASIDHTYEATAVEFPDGRVVKSLVGSHLNNSWRTDEGTLSLVMSVRLRDISFVVNELERFNTALGNPFTGKLDTSRLALMGHSLGGEATIVGLQQESRFRVGVILDGVLADTSAAETEQALLILGAGREQWRKEECELWAAMKGPRLAVNLKGSEHLSLSDAVWLAKGAIKTGTMGPDKTIAAVRDYVAGFLNENLRSGPANRLLAGPSADYPDAEVTTQGQVLCRQP
jgi:dienelactone hydrolase